MAPSNLRTPAAAVDRADRTEAGAGDRPVRCGVVGVGRMGTHPARLYTEIQGAELVGVVDPDPRRRDDARSQWGVETFETVEQLLARSPEAVSIATPTAQHRAVAEPLLFALAVPTAVGPTEKLRPVDDREAPAVVALAREVAVASPTLSDERLADDVGPPSRVTVAFVISAVP